MMKGERKERNLGRGYQGTDEEDRGKCRNFGIFHLIQNFLDFSLKGFGIGIFPFPKKHAQDNEAHEKGLV